MTDADFTVAISSDFIDALGNLPNNSRNKVSAFISKFRKNPRIRGLNYEHIKGSKDPGIRSLRVDRNVRCIVRAPSKGNAYVLLWVDKHDDAYQWARRNTCHVNRVSGALQVVDIEAAEIAVRESPSNISATPTAKRMGPSVETTNSLFAGYGDDQLMLLGVPELLLPAVRVVSNKETLVRLIEHLSKSCSKSCVDGLILLAEGKSIDEVINELEREQPAAVDPEDVAAALKTPESQAEFMVITDDDLLEEMLSAPLQQWRVFLHPSQRRLVEKNWKGPVCVLGGAGTGKTVVAMHRARWLAKQFIKEDTPGQVLFTTFTRNLATDIRSNLTKICSSEELQRIEVVNLDCWMIDYLNSQGLEIDVFNEELKSEAWNLAMSSHDPSIKLDLHFYKEEWKDVIFANGCHSLDDYLKVQRVGRGISLSKQERAKIWPVFDALRAEFRKRDLKEPEEARQAAAKLLRESGTSAFFRAVVVDEAQDLDAASFKLIRALAGKPHDNDIFIVGDPHQRIYGKPVILSNCGIQIQERSCKLRINYRTTEETRAWATDLLRGLDFDDLDGGSDSASGYRSILHGDEPLIQAFGNSEDEETFIINLLRQIHEKQGTLASTCLVVRTSKLVQHFKSMLDGESINNIVIGPNEVDDPNDVSVRLATMHRVKGLEFDQVLIPALNSDQMPLKRVLDRKLDWVSKERFEQQERSLLHVAATRAKKRVIISYSGKGSAFIT